MARKLFLLFFFTLTASGFSRAQAFIKTADLFSRQGSHGSLVIDQNPALDSLISRYISANKNIRTDDGKQGMKGVRIQVYYNGTRNAYEEANKVMGQLLNKFPDLKAYIEFEGPVWYKVRIGNYRTITESYKDLVRVKREFPDAYPVINSNIYFPDLIKK